MLKKMNVQSVKQRVLHREEDCEIGRYSKKKVVPKQKTTKTKVHR